MLRVDQQGFTRRDFIKLGTVGGVALFLGRLPTADALEVHSGPTATGWIGRDGKPKYRWDAIRKVTGQKDFAFDYRSRDLPGWPAEQGYAFMLKATDAEHRFEGVDLSALGDTLQPDKLLMQKDLAAHNLERSEEHTSELQSRGHLVCRLLLEKKKEKIRHRALASM